MQTYSIYIVKIVIKSKYTFNKLKNIQIGNFNYAVVIIYVYKKMNKYLHTYIHSYIHSNVKYKEDV